MTKLENALIWLYMKTWGKFGDHVMEEKDLWNFNGDDLEKAIVGLAFPRKKEKTERFKVLTALIMEKFEQDRTAFYEWAAKIHGEFIEDLPKAIETAQNGKNLHLIRHHPFLQYQTWSGNFHVYKNLYFPLDTNLKEVTTSQQQQVFRIANELNQLERHSKENQQELSRLSALATDLWNQFKLIQIQKWDPGKYSLK